jgi:hypothetical protein
MEPYYYLASYPKSGNTWCRAFIAALHRQLGSAENNDASPELRLNQDLATGSIVSSRHWLDDQLGIDSADLRPEEIDKLRGRAGHQPALYSESMRYHKVHDAFVSPDSAGRPVVPTEGCRGVVVVIRDPADVAVSLSHFWGWDLERTVAFLLDPQACMVRSRKRAGSQVRQFLGRWDQHLASWLGQELLPLLLLRYEDLLAEPEHHFRRLATFLNLAAGPEPLARALEETRFEALRAKEDAAGGFVENSRHQERFFRSGRSGEGRERLSSYQLEQLQAAFAPTLAVHGYTSNRSPSTPLAS